MAMLAFVYARIRALEIEVSEIQISTLDLVETEAASAKVRTADRRKAGGAFRARQRYGPLTPEYL